MPASEKSVEAGPLSKRATLPPIPSLTGARFFAALFVVVFHTESVWLDGASLIDGPIRNIMKSGFTSVGFFFILSGFVLGYR